MLTLDDQVYPYPPSWVWKGQTPSISRFVTLVSFHKAPFYLSFRCGMVQSWIVTDGISCRLVSFLGPFSAEGPARRKHSWLITDSEVSRNFLSCFIEAKLIASSDILGFKPLTSLSDSGMKSRWFWCRGRACKPTTPKAIDQNRESYLYHPITVLIDLQAFCINVDSHLISSKPSNHFWRTLSLTLDWFLATDDFDLDPVLTRE